MKQYLFAIVLFSMLFVLPGCGAVETIFKAGMWWAFFLVFIVIFLIAWIFLRKKK